MSESRRKDRGTAGPRLAAVALSFAATMAASSALAQSGETYVATATVKTAAGASITAPVEISVTRWTTDAERDKAIAALKSGGPALKTLLDAAPAAGTIQIGERKSTLRYARSVPTAGGRLITAIVPQAIVHLGAGLPDAAPKAGYDFAVALFEVNQAGTGTAGDLAVAATLTVRSGDSIVVQDYGAEAIRLGGIRKK
jgi:hypothetical protein